MSRRPPSHPRTVLLVMCVGYFLVLLDVTVVNVTLPSIAASLGSSVAGLQWVVDGYAIALAALLLSAGTLGDLRGHRQVVLVGLGVFGLASLGCAIAPSTGWLVAARVAQGVGAALLLPGTLAVISRTFPENGARARAIGTWAAVGGAGLPAGPLVGGLLVHVAGWRWVFVVNVPIVLAALVVATRVVPRDTGDPSRRLDLAGTACGAVALGAAVFAVVEAGHAGTGAPVVLATVVLLVAAGLFVVVERRVPHPVLPLGLLARPPFVTANGVAGTMNLGTLGLLFVLTLYLQGERGFGPLAAGVALLPLFLPLAGLAPVSGRATARLGSWPVMTLGLVVAAVGVALTTTWSSASPYPWLAVAMVAWGAGVGLLTPAVVNAAVEAVPDDRAGLASGVNNTARQAGGAVGIAAFGAVAGAPSGAGFLAGLHVLGAATGGLFAVAAVASLVVGRRVG